MANDNRKLTEEQKELYKTMRRKYSGKLTEEQKELYEAMRRKYSGKLTEEQKELYEAMRRKYGKVKYVYPFVSKPPHLPLALQKPVSDQKE